MRCTKFLHTFLYTAALGAGLGLATASFAADNLKPYVLGKPPEGDRAKVIESATKALADNGFQVVGRYSPYAAATVLAVTSDDLRAAAAKSDYGGYGAVARVSVSEGADKKLQLAYTNLRYNAAAYRMKADLGAIAGRLDTALGRQSEFGSEDGLSDSKLRGYRYMIGMERFDSLDDHLIAEFKSHAEALAAVDAGLAARRGGVGAVYRVAIPGKDEVVFGVSIAEGEGGDQYIMDRIDAANAVKYTPHLPYEVLVSGGKVYSLYARFRIAMSFPDLSMMGTGSFMSIMSAPNAIKGSLTKMVTGK